jgi:hypothetical protein
MTLPSFPERVNERAGRLVAGTVALSLAGAWLAGRSWMIVALSLGFVLRWGWGPRFSPLGRVAAWIAPRLWDVRLVAGPPKRFAQGIGALCLLGASALLLAGWNSLAWGVAGLVAVLASLESAFGFCMGCWLYGRMREHRGAPALCEDCVVPRRARPPGAAVVIGESVESGRA